MPKRAALLVLCLMSTTAHAQQKISIFVGPQTRDGFVDVDSGGMNSLKDIRSEFEKSREFSVARTRDEADIVLTLVQRRTPGESGSIGVPIGTNDDVSPREASGDRHDSLRQKRIREANHERTGR
jgi:hypothetical protein